VWPHGDRNPRKVFMLSKSKAASCYGPIKGEHQRTTSGRQDAEPWCKHVTIVIHYTSGGWVKDTKETESDTLGGRGGEERKVCTVCVCVCVCVCVRERERGREGEREHV
jgi:hypothetical protein